MFTIIPSSFAAAPAPDSCRCRSAKGVLRGAVFDVPADTRNGYATFDKWEGMELSEDNHKQLWIPAGIAQGFLVTSDSAEFLYKTTDYYAPEHERCIAWNDPNIGIAWPDAVASQLSDKDRARSPLRIAAVFP